MVKSLKTRIPQHACPSVTPLPPTSASVWPQAMSLIIILFQVNGCCNIFIVHVNYIHTPSLSLPPSLLPSLPPSLPIATLNEDYLAPPAVLQALSSIHGPDSDLCFEIAIIDDELVETEECFAVSISLEDTGLMVAVDEDSDSSVCCILDNDSECF